MSTYKQKLTALKLVENGGNFGKAMIEAGYSKSMAKNPYKLTRSKGWLEATQDLFSNEYLVKKHSEILNSMKTVKYTFPKDMSDKDIRFTVCTSSEVKVIYIKEENNTKVCACSIPNDKIRLSAIDMGYKIRGLYNKPKNHSVREESEDVKATIKRVSSLLTSHQ